MLYLSAYFESHRETNYDLLLNISQRGAWRDWTVFFLQSVALQSQDTIDRANKLQDLKVTWEKTLEKNRASVLTLNAARILFEAPLISANFLVERLSITHQASMNILRRLEDMQFVQEITGRKRERLYRAPAIIQILA